MCQGISVDHMWNKGETCKIVCTQPRRISATSGVKSVNLMKYLYNIFLHSLLMIVFLHKQLLREFHLKEVKALEILLAIRYYISMVICILRSCFSSIFL